MTYTILVNSDKSLEKTITRPVYVKESRADEIQFLIDPDLLGTEDMTNYKVLLQVLLPHYDTNTDSNEPIGKMRYMEIENEQYLGMFRTTLPITTTLTEEVGRVQFWFCFFDMEDLDKIKLTKTGACNIDILPSADTSIEILDDEETFDVLTRMQDEIDELNLNKIDKQFIFNEEEGTIQFFANGEPIGEPIKIDNEVAWRNWED